ncbi:hypothetical protein BN77_p30043 [Rhizobium mesoamericanum STM3625]|uniref:Uncharacterized protein n=1 Tax=Rhizobium mesoamericanum STM3625 TaxID=1211777 RepID=K0Q6C5_9HYPH|nr:hypothetical protein BN77_p30043 [Rhizobium mesoamericanum STM3625]
MRQERTVHASIFDLFAEHEIGRELKAMWDWLDGHRDLLGLVARNSVKATGRQGRRRPGIARPLPRGQEARPQGSVHTRSADPSPDLP